MKPEGERTLIFDIFRNRWVVLTPEEWVRQHMARYLADDLGYPSSLILLEATVSVNGMVRRCDLLVYDREGHPVMIGECKAPEVKISQKVFDQVARYNLALGIELLLITNGLEHYCLQSAPGADGYSFLPEIPQFGSLASQSSRNI
ncbi:MAG: type I restriction enzyme HsdR N-terminal domain-containing protein [Bacteroidales bacterium]